MAKLNHVFGNYFSLRIPLIKRTRTVIDGEETATDTEYTPSPSESVSVRLIRRKGRAFSYIPTVDGSTVTISDEGKLPLGTYDVEVTITGGDHPMRFCDEDTIEVHYATEAAGIVPGETLTAITYTLNGAVFFRMGEASGAGPGTASKQWVTENFQPKGNYLTREQLFAATLREMMSIEVITPYNHHAASVPIVSNNDYDLCLLFDDYDGKIYEPLVFTVKRTGASWQEVEDTVTAAGYEIVGHEMVLLRKQKRRKRSNGRISDNDGETYLRKYKRGYIPYLPKYAQGSNPFAGKDFLHEDRIDMLITDFLKYDGMENEYSFFRYCVESNRDSFIRVHQKEHRGSNHHTEYELEVFLRGIPIVKRNIQIGSNDENYENRLYKGHNSIDCAIAEMVEVKGHRRFYGNAVYGRLNLAVSNVVVDGYMADDITGKHLTLSFVPRYSIANDIGSFHAWNDTQGDSLP